jgi:photosystem II stability/assembly factor-like uncharacterized protein
VRMPRLAFLLAVAVATADAQATFPTASIHNLKWRMIGPFRAGRTKSAAGVPSQPNVFYMAPSNGGVWKSTDYGRTWLPIFDDQPSQSIGAIEVSLSNPNVIYVGSGEGLQRPDLSTGDGMWRSDDAGKTWRHIGLGDAQQIPRIAIDPRNPDRVFVAALGHPYGPNVERGIFRSLDGGRTWRKILYTDENTGGADIVMSPSDPNTLYADMWEARQGPWENGAFGGPGTGMYKTTDGGETWTKLAGGLPTAAEGLGRIGISIAPSNTQRLYITATAGAKSGIWRSDDGGASWTRTTDDNRIFGRGDDFAALTVHPRNPDLVYSANVVAWKSTDGGYKWNSHRGAPGGDDYQRYWINPNNPDVMLVVADQGAIVTVNGGETWSSWYNQPTAQFYHVTATNTWPYELCGGQQESGSACVKSRGNDGSIGYREFHPVGASEYSYVAPDPLNPDIFYGGTVTRFDRRTGQTQNVSPNAGAGRGSGPNLFRGVRTMPILFSPINKRKLYYSTNVLWETVDGGQHWKQKSPDLTRATWEVPKSVGKYIGTPAAAPSQRGVIYTIAPSPVDSNTIWVGTDDGLIHVTRDNGKTWKDVTPPAIGAWMKISIMDASHFDANTAYAAVNTLRIDDLNPHLFRTTDGGKSWTEIVSGIEKGASTNTIKEDPKRRGLLFAGTERTVWASLDNGDHWHSLRLNLPGTSMRDLVVVNDDVAVGTHGRGFWVLDDISSLRQWSEKAATDAVSLFKPALATRVRYSMYTDTPVPPDEPMAENPPDGAVIEYVLRNDARDVKLEIVGAGGRVIRTFSSGDKFDPPQDDGNAPWYWGRPLSPLSNRAGINRYVWDLHYSRPTGQPCSLPISATPRNTKCEPEGPWVHPGVYSVRLTVDGATYTQPLTVRVDPRVKATTAALKQQYDLSIGLYDAHEISTAAQAKITALRATLSDRKMRATRLSAAANPGDAIAALDALDAKLLALAGASGGGRGGRGGGGRGGAPAAGAETFSSIAGSVLGPLNVIQDADEQPVSAVVTAATERINAFKALEAKWNAILKTDLPALNAKLKAVGATEVAIP